MGSKCCDCTTEWSTWRYEYDLVARMGQKYTTPSQCPDQTLFAAGYPCSHYLDDSRGSASWGDIQIVGYTPVERIMKSGPTPSMFCDCTNTNGGQKWKDNPFQREKLNEITLLTKERKTNKDYWMHNCTPVYSDKIPAQTVAYYKFILTIYRIPEDWSKKHKCGKDCPGDKKISPELFDIKSNKKQEFIKIANDYTFPG